MVLKLDHINPIVPFFLHTLMILNFCDSTPLLWKASARSWHHAVQLLQLMEESQVSPDIISCSQEDWEPPEISIWKQRRNWTCLDFRMMMMMMMMIHDSWWFSMIQYDSVFCGFQSKELSPKLAAFFTKLPTAFASLGPQFDGQSTSGVRAAQWSLLWTTHPDSRDSRDSRIISCYLRISCAKPRVEAIFATGSAGHKLEVSELRNQSQSRMHVQNLCIIKSTHISVSMYIYIYI